MFKQTQQFHDWEQHFAEEGFLVLTSRYRSSDGSEETIVKEVLEEVFKRQVDLDTILNGKLMTQEMAFIQSNQVSVDLDEVRSSGKPENSSGSFMSSHP